MSSAVDTSEQTDEAALAVGGMDCASCVAHVERAARGVGGVQACQVNLARGRAVVQFDPARTSGAAIAKAISESGYAAAVEHGDLASAEHDRLTHQRAHAHAWLMRAIAGLALWLPVELAHWTMVLLGAHPHGPAGVSWMTWIGVITSTVAIVYVGAGFYRGAWAGLRRGTANMDTLIAMGASVAYGYSLAALLGFLLGWWDRLPSLYFMESTGLLALISLGHWLEARARDKAGSAIRELLDLTPAVALRLDEGNEPVQVPVHQIVVGDRVLVRPGDRIAIDGAVAEGQSEVDESMITGESLPVARGVGENVIGGTLNQAGRLVVRATRVGADTALAQIVQLVEKAQSSKPPVQRLADNVAAVFVPIVLGIALATGVGWYIWGRLQGWDAAGTWGYIANAVCSVLIIACPCALGLAVPAALMVGTGRGARRGILIRDIDALQTAERIDTVVLDKTGTITRGRPDVVDVLPAEGVLAHELLGMAAGAEQFSEHPLAHAIFEHTRRQGIELSEPDEFRSESGLGVVATMAGRKVLAGSRRFLAGQGVMQISEDDAGQAGPRTLVHVAEQADGVWRYLGAIALADPIKPDSRAAIAELHRLGMRTVLLTGDNAATAAAIAQAAGIEDVRAEVRPQDKAAIIETLRNEGGKRRYVAMVGDGINDAPALATADLGLAIGSGSDIAKETGGVVLVSGSLHGIAAAIRLSRATMRTIRQNLFFAFIYNVLAIPLAAAGVLSPLIGAGAMALSDVTVIGNALLLRRSRID